MKRFLVCAFLFILSVAYGQESFVEVNGVKLFCNIIGDGDPVIVIHGGPGLSQRYLLPYMEPVGEGHQAIFYDQRASGRSEGNADTLTIEQFVDDIEGLRTGLGLSKFSLLGHSWGGFLAMQYAIKYPNNLNKLVLLNSACLSTEDLFSFLGEWNRRMDPYMDQINALQETEAFANGDPETVASFMKIIFRTYCYNPSDLDKLNIIAPVEENKKWSNVQQTLNGILVTVPFDLTEDLKKVGCQTLIIHGDVDPIPLATIEHIHQCLKNSNLVILKECGHFPYVEQPQELFKTLNRFLSN